MTATINLARTIVYLKHPQMTSAFDVAVIHAADRRAELRGEDLSHLRRFLKTAPGVPQFDVEFAEHQYCKCVLEREPTGESISFSFETVVLVDEHKSNPGRRYF